MHGDTLLLAINAAHSTVSLSFGDQSAAARIPLPAGFERKDLTAALLATGWVQGNEQGLQMATDHSCRYLADVLAAMLDLFESPEQPRHELLEAEQAIGEYYDFQAAGVDLPWFALAWMHVMLREAIVEEARCTEDIWADTAAKVIPVSRYRDELVQLMIGRYAAASNESVVGKLAASRSTRRAGSSNAKSG